MGGNQHGGNDGRDHAFTVVSYIASVSFLMFTHDINLRPGWLHRLCVG